MEAAVTKEASTALVVRGKPMDEVTAYRLTALDQRLTGQDTKLAKIEDKFYEEIEGVKKDIVDVRLVVASEVAKATTSNKLWTSISMVVIPIISSVIFYLMTHVGSPVAPQVDVTKPMAVATATAGK